MGGKVLADLGDVLCEVSKERSSAVGGGIRAKADVVDECAFVNFLREFTDGAKTLCFVARARSAITWNKYGADLLVSKAMPYHERIRVGR